jgi:hypothetical protein
VSRTPFEVALWENTPGIRADGAKDHTKARYAFVGDFRRLLLRHHRLSVPAAEWRQKDIELAPTSSQRLDSRKS